MTVKSLTVTVLNVNHKTHSEQEVLNAYAINSTYDWINVESVILSLWLFDIIVSVQFKALKRCHMIIMA